MFSRNILRGASIVVLGLGSAAFAAGNAPTFVGGHEPARQFQQTYQTTPAPYALTGSETSPVQHRIVELRVGSRIVAIAPTGN